MTEPRILLGFEVPNGKDIYMKLHHTVVTGMTQLSGKTTTLEAIIQRSGLRAIAFKTKRGETGFSSYNEVAPFFVERSDWKYVSSLLEAMLRERMKFERSWIIKATKGTRTLKEVYDNVRILKEKARKDSLTESVYVTLEEYLAGIIPQIEKFNFVKELQLVNGINVMDLSEMTLEMRSLVIRSVMEQVIDHMSNIVVVIPEAWEYIPQGRATPVKLYAETFIRKGASVGNYLFVDSQDVAGIDKTPLRSCDNWIMGRQKETHEVERFREIMGKTIPEEEIRTLPLGHYFAFLGNEIRKVYILPVGVPEDVGRKVAMNQLTPEFLRDNYLKRKEVDEQVYRSMYEEEKLRREELEKKLVEMRTSVLTSEEIQNYKDTIKSLGETVNKFEDENRNLRVDLKIAEELVDTKDNEKQDLRLKDQAQIQELSSLVTDLKEKLKHFEYFEEALRGILEPYMVNVARETAPTGSDKPLEISVAGEQPTISIKVERKQLSVTDKDLLGKICLIYIEGELATDWFTVSDVTHIFEKHAWARDPRASSMLDDLVRWGYLEKRFSGKRPEYKVKINPEDAKSKGLLRVEE